MTISSSRFDRHAASLPAIDLDWLAGALRDRVPGARGLSRAERMRLDRSGAAALQIDILCQAAGVRLGGWSDAPDAAALPLLAWLPGTGVCLVYAESADGGWRADGADGPLRLPARTDGAAYAALRQADEDTQAGRLDAAAASARALIGRVLRRERPAFAWAAAASLLANTVALAGSMYSMQIYDRVIPTQGLSTLWVLTIGALIACVFELVVKSARSGILEASMRRMDTALSHAVFKRLLDVRADQLPAGIGSVSAQVRGYEPVRAFVSTMTMYAAVDAPFGLFFLAVMALLGGIEIAAVPALFAALSVAVGLMFRRRIAAHAKTASAAGHRKAGLLVDTLAGAEAIKAAGAGWAQGAKWNALHRQSMDDELKIRHYSESASHLAAFLQQASYVAMIATGAYLACTAGSVTTGGLIACSILSGRVLGPIAMLPGLIVQWAHARSALDNLERLFALECDHHGVARPLAPETLAGRFELEDVRFAYPRRPPALTIPRLSIGAGEKVAFLGPVGAGKSTLLKLLAGLYKPQQGRVLVDGLEMQQIGREHLAQHLGWLGQEVALGAGTLRENLSAGRPDLDEAALLAACRATGLGQLVAAHPQGLDLEIAEGGVGVSGGQRQLIGLTRLVLAKPAVWLLDEPTSAMDEANERLALALLARSVGPAHTVLLVTHKPQLLGLVDRIVVLAPGGIAMDGPRDAVLAALAAHERGAGRMRAVPATSAAPAAHASPAQEQAA